MITDLIYILILTLVILWAYKVYYNLYISPLKQVPGPIVLQFFPIIFIAIQIYGTDHLYMDLLHKKYGEVVRIGWNVVSFNNSESCKQIYSTYKFPKDILYSGFLSIGETIFSTLNREHHRNRKKILQPSFSETNIQSLEPIVKKVGVEALLDKIEELYSQNKEIDLKTLFNFTTFDIIGMVLFNKSFDVLKNHYHPVIVWIDTIFFNSLIRGLIPILNFYKDSGTKNLLNFVNIQMEKYSPDKSKHRKCLMDSFIEARDGDNKLKPNEVVEEVAVQLGAGIDTTSNSLTWIFYLMLKNPKVYSKVVNEVRTKFPTLQSINYNACKNECAYLGAVISEGLRFKPIASLILPRISPVGGATLQGYYIPEGTTVGTNLYCLHRYEKYFENPDEYIPERWIENGKFRNLDAFFPFSMGPRGCIGRGLAQLELYSIIASLIWKFDFSIDPQVRIHGKNNFILKAQGKLVVNIEKIH